MNRTNIISSKLSVKLIVLSLIIIFSFAFIMLTGVDSYAQNSGIGINISGSPANSKALLDIDATGMNQKAGLLLPRMNTIDRNAIPAPIPESLLIYNTDTHCFEANYNGSWVSWACLGGCQFPAQPIAGTNTFTSSQITWNWSNVSVSTSYQWNTSNTFPGAGVNSLSSPSYTQTGLECSTSYSLYIWAYNTCGNSTYTILTQNTSSCAHCDQIWASSNANTGTQILDAIDQKNDALIEEYCYNDLPANCTTYGGLYVWTEAVQLANAYTYSLYGTQPWMTCNPCGNSGRQGICPAGYHIPTDLEWSNYEYCLENKIAPTGNTTLDIFQTEIAARGSDVSGVGSGDKMKVTSSDIPAWDGTNTSGFGALPAGFCAGSCSFIGTFANYWSATEEQSVNYSAWDREEFSNGHQSSRYPDAKFYGKSVRCLQN